jgi:hypothetical protein
VLTGTVFWKPRSVHVGVTAHLPVGKMRGAEAADGDGLVGRRERCGWLRPDWRVGRDF